jgi:hypothetical protein
MYNFIGLKNFLLIKCKIIFDFLQLLFFVEQDAAEGFGTGSEFRSADHIIADTQVPTKAAA